MSKYVPLYLIGLCFALISCAPPSVLITALAPGNSPDAPKLRKVAVLPFEGNNGKEFAAEVEATLASVNVANKQYFEFVDRMALDKVLSEMKLSMTGIIDPSAAVKVGKMTGAKGIYTGIVTGSHSNDSGYRENRTRCAYNVTQYDKKGNPYQVCGGYETYSVPCRKRVAIFSFTPKLVEVETGRIVYANNLSGEAISNSCSDSSSPLVDAFELIDRAKKFTLEKMRTDVAPHYVQKSVKLMDETDGITSKNAKAKFKSGLDFAKGNRFDRACELWGEARILSPLAPSILYNLAVCSEVTGRLNEALSLCNDADKQLGKPDDRITAELAGIKDSIEKKKRLSEQMVR